jgi:transcriptional activator SPT7
LPPPFIPLSAPTYINQLPALLHAFFASRIESGLGLADEEFDGPQAQIGSLGQVVVRAPTQQGVKRKKDGGNKGDDGMNGNGNMNGLTREEREEAKRKDKEKEVEKKKKVPKIM